jgi:hypothetical protein
MSKALYKKENLGGKKSKVVSLRRKTGVFCRVPASFIAPALAMFAKMVPIPHFVQKKTQVTNFITANADVRSAATRYYCTWKAQNSHPTDKTRPMRLNKPSTPLHSPYFPGNSLCLEKYSHL